MAILRSNGVLFVDAIPAHTPTNNEATLAVLDGGTTVWYYDGAAWQVAPFTYNFANQNLTFTGNRTHDAAGYNFTLQDGTEIYLGTVETTPGGEDSAIVLEAFSTNGSDRIEIQNGEINIIKNYGPEYTQLKFDDNGVWLLQSEGKYLIGDGLGFGIGAPTTDEDADHDLVWSSADSRLGKKEAPKVFKAEVTLQDNDPDPFTVSFVTIYKNTLGEVPTISVDGDGELLITTVADVFTANKTFALVSSRTPDFWVVTENSGDENEWKIRIVNPTTGVVESIDGDLFISIEVYP